MADHGAPVEVTLTIAAGPADRFTWGYEGDGQALPAGSSTVGITLEPVDGGTLVRLRHAGLPAGEPPLAHLAGWRHALATRAAGSRCCRAAWPAADGSAGCTASETRRRSGPSRRSVPDPTKPS